MHHIVKCESNYRPDVQSFHPDPNSPNGREESYGLVQIHLPSHPSVSLEQATDIEFALDFLASNVKNGKQRMWTCGR